MGLNRDTLDRLLQINWFTSLGDKTKISTNHDILFVEDKDIAKQLCENPDWENTTLDAANNVRIYLQNKFKNNHPNWNSLAKEARPFVIDRLIPKILNTPAAKTMGDLFIECVRWDLIHILIVDAYRKQYRENEFYKDQLTIYEAGHFPCGFNHETASFYVY